MAVNRQFLVDNGLVSRGEENFYGWPQGIRSMGGSLRDTSLIEAAERAGFVGARGVLYNHTFHAKTVKGYPQRWDIPIIGHSKDYGGDESTNITNLLAKIDELMNKKTKLELTIKGYSQINEGLQGKIDELKGILLDDKFIEVTFQGYKKEVLKKKKATLKFTLYENSYCLVLIYDNQSPKYIPLDKFEYVRVVNANEDLVEIKYMKGENKNAVKSYVFEDNSLSFVNAFKEYSLKAIRKKNNEEIFKRLNI
jgi:hypothetical protein